MTRFPAAPAVPVDPARDTPPPGLLTAVLNAGVWLASRTPLRLASALAWVIAWVWWTVLPIRKRVAVANFRASFPDLQPRPALLRMMHNLVLSYFEFVQFEHVAVTVEGAEGLFGVVIVAGHGGAWDATILGTAEVTPMTIFFRTPANRWVQALLARLRDEHGVQRLETGATMADGYAALAAGRNVYFVQDQRHNKGPAIPLLGRPARTSLGAAAASIKTGRPLYGAWQSREGIGRHTIRFERLDFEGDAAARTEAINRWYGEQIRMRPHGWLWLHDRWK